MNKTIMLHIKILFMFIILIMTSCVNSYKCDCQAILYSKYLYLPHKLEGYFDLDQAICCSHYSNKPIMVYISGITIDPHLYTENVIWSNNDVYELIKNNFTLVYLTLDPHIIIDSINTFSEDLGRLNKQIAVEKLNYKSGINTVILSSNGGSIIGNLRHPTSVEEYKSFLQDCLKRNSTVLKSAENY